MALLDHIIIGIGINKEVMKLHLQQISKATPKGRYAVVVMDGAGWHTQELADELDNLSLIKIPPYSPNSIQLSKYGSG